MALSSVDLSECYSNDENEREITQTDRINGKLLRCFLERLNKSEAFMPDSCKMQPIQDKDNDGFQDDSVLAQKKVQTNGETDGNCTTKTVVIGISGVTNSGKTTLVQYLCDCLVGQSVAINQDRYFLPPDTDKLAVDPEINHKNWDTLQALEMDRMMTDVYRLIAHADREGSRLYCARIIFIDGFLIFNHSELAKLCTLKYFLEVPRDISETRRAGRSYDPPDVPKYFEKCVWPMYLKNRAEIQHIDDIVYLDGTRSTQDLGSEIIRRINLVLNV